MPRLRFLLWPTPRRRVALLLHVSRHQLVPSCLLVAHRSSHRTLPCQCSAANESFEGVKDIDPQQPRAKSPDHSVSRRSSAVLGCQCRLHAVCASAAANPSALSPSTNSDNCDRHWKVGVTLKLVGHGPRRTSRIRSRASWTRQCRRPAKVSMRYRSLSCRWLELICASGCCHASLEASKDAVLRS